MAKHVLVKTSDRVDPDDASSTGKWLKNGAGNWFNPNYGFGNINAVTSLQAMIIMPNIRASYGYEFLRDSQNITSRLAQGSSHFITQIISPDRNSLLLGAGITAYTIRNLSLYLTYGAQIGESRYIAHSVNAGLRVGF